jgi:hypothetical protein
MYYVNQYEIDWDKVNSFEDIKRILRATNMVFDPPMLPREIEDLVILKEKPKPRFVND